MCAARPHGDPDRAPADTEPDKILVWSITDGDTSCPTPSRKGSGQNGQRNPEVFCSKRVRKRKSFSSFFLCVFLQHLYSILHRVCKWQQLLFIYAYFFCARPWNASTWSYVKPLPGPFSAMVGAIIFPFYGAIIRSLKRLSDLTKGTQLKMATVESNSRLILYSKAHLLGVYPWTIYVFFISLSFCNCRVGIIAPIK